MFVSSLQLRKVNLNSEPTRAECMRFHELFVDGVQAIRISETSTNLPRVSHSFMSDCLPVNSNGTDGADIYVRN